MHEVENGCKPQKLFKLLIDREMKSKELAANAGISPATLAKMKKDKRRTREDLHSTRLHDG